MLLSYVFRFSIHFDHSFPEVANLSWGKAFPIFATSAESASAGSASAHINPPHLKESAHIDPTAGSKSEGILERHKRGTRQEDENSSKEKAYNRHCLLR